MTDIKARLRYWLSGIPTETSDLVRDALAAIVALEGERDTFKSAWEAAGTRAQKAIRQMADERIARKAADAQLTARDAEIARLNEEVASASRECRDNYIADVLLGGPMPPERDVLDDRHELPRPAWQSRKRKEGL